MQSNIEAARARAALPSNCSECGSLAVFVLESRTTAKARRRRKECARCGHRETTYEISQEQYRQLLGQSRSSPGPKVAKAEPKPDCKDCIHWEKETTSCGFDFPEAGGWFAADCGCYSASE